jgi:predicted double-glycine peptidase
MGILCLAIPLLAAAVPLHALELDIGNGMRVRQPVTTLKELRDRNVVRQSFDYSCGAAALATLLTYGFGDPVSEKEILSSILNRLSGDQEALRRKEGLSLLDLQRYAHERGYRALGFRLQADQLSKLARPVMVFISPRGYEHFAVLRGIRGNRAFIADPATGNIRMSVQRFRGMWQDEGGKGVIFVVERRDSGDIRSTPLEVHVRGLVRPEVLSARQLLSVGPRRYHAGPPIH